jgi:outer membrane protein OmpA-like peptidoglycan-associated protein
LISDMASRFGIDRAKVTAALGFALPAIVSLVTRGGAVPAALPAEAESFIGNRHAWAAAPPADVPAPAKNWLPWVAGALIALLTLDYCSVQKRTEPVAAMLPEVAVAEPEGAAVVAAVTNGNPLLKVYFDVAKTDVASEFAEKAAALIAHMNANPSEVAVISGFNDPTGDAAANAKLAKRRAEAVQEKLVAAGIAKERTLLEKPAETTGTAATNAASRRVDVMLR